MLTRFVVLAALGAACAGCSAPPFHAAPAADDPANPEAPAAPFMRPANVLEDGTPQAASAGRGAMPGMDMSGAPAGGMR